jgi:hypothetical protein
MIGIYQKKLSLDYFYKSPRFPIYPLNQQDSVSPANSGNMLIVNLNLYYEIPAYSYWL